MTPRSIVRRCILSLSILLYLGCSSNSELYPESQDVAVAFSSRTQPPADTRAGLTGGITDSKGTPYSRILHHDVQSEPSTVTIASASPVNLEAGKRYTLVCYIGVEHVAFQVVSVEDWDFPLRFAPSVTDFANPYNESTGENGTSKTLSED